MEDEQFRVYMEEHRLAENVREFLRTPVGEYLLGRAEIDMHEAKEELVRINPHGWFSRRKYAAAKARYEVAASFLRWLNEALVNGDVALAQIEDGD